MSVSTIVIFRVKQGKESEFETALDRVLEATSKTDGFVRCDRYRDPGDRQRYVLHEIWKSSKLLDAHVGTDYFAEFVEETTALVESKDVYLLNPF